MLIRHVSSAAVLYVACAAAGLLAALPYTYVGGPAAPGGAVAGYNPVGIGAVDGGGNMQAWQTAQTLTLLTSAARTATVASAAQTNYSNRGVILTVNVTAASGTGGLNMQLQVQDAVSGNWFTYTAYGSTTKLTAIGTYAFVSYPAASGGTWSNSGAGSAPLPQMWRLNVAVGDSSSYTYSVSAQVVP